MAIIATDDVLLRVLEQNTDAYDRLQASIDRMVGASDTADRSIASNRSSLLELDAAANIAAKGIGAVKAAVSALETPLGLALSFETEFALVRTLNAKIGKDLERQLLDLAARVPQTAGDLTRATYDAISAGIDPGDVTRFLESASAAAVAGNTDMTSAVSVLTTAVNAFGDQGVDAARAADVLFGTVRAGVTDFQQLAESLGSGASTGALGVRFEELNAAAATLTKTLGISTSEAFTRVNALVNQLVRDGGPMQKNLKAIGVEASVTALQGKGLAAVLEEIQAGSKGSAQVLGTLSRRSEATSALLGLLGKNTDTFRETLDAVTNSAGETENAVGIMGDTTQGAINKLQAGAEGVLRDIGVQLLPTMRQQAELFAETMATRGPEIVSAFSTVAESILSMTVAMAGAVATVAEFFDLVPGFKGERAKDAARSSAADSTRDRVVTGGGGPSLADIARIEGEDAAREAAEQRAAFAEAESARANRLFAAASRDVRAAEARLTAADASRRRELGVPSNTDLAEFGGGSNDAQIAARRALSIAQGQARAAQALRAAAEGAGEEIAARLVDALGGAAVGGGSGSDGAVPPPPPPPPPDDEPPPPLGRRRNLDAELFAETDAAIRAGEDAIKEVERQEAAQERLHRDATDRRIALIQDEDARRIAAMGLRHTRELELAREQGLETAELRRVQVGEIAAVEGELNRRRRDDAKRTATEQSEAYRSSISANISALGNLSDALGAAGVANNQFRAILLGAEGVWHAFEAVSEGADAGTAFASGNIPKGLAHVANVTLHTAASIRAFADAGKLGGGGSAASAGGATGGGGGRPSAPETRRPPVRERGAESGGKSEFHFHMHDLMMPPDPAQLERHVPAMAEAFNRAGLTSGLSGMPGADAFSAA